MVREAGKTAERHDSLEAIQREARRVAEMIRSAKHCVAFTGAGISTSAGVCVCVCVCAARVVCVLHARACAGLSEPSLSAGGNRSNREKLIGATTTSSVALSNNWLVAVRGGSLQTSGNWHVDKKNSMELAVIRTQLSTR